MLTDVMGNEFTKLAARHTTTYSVVVGLILASLLTLKGIPLAGSVVAGAIFALLTWLMWRPGGWARRHTAVPEGPVDTRKILTTLAFAVIVFAAVVGVIWATQQ